ncbi:MAG: beta-eliminating lyase-related protein [Pseudomonadota bacterium]
MFFTSDNASGAAPEILAAVAAADPSYTGAYGGDQVTERAVARVREVFEAPEAAVYFVATGTAANALALATLCPPWGAVYCHRISHVEVDECGAPEFFTGGAKLTLLDGDHAKLQTASLEEAARMAAPVGVHNVQRGAVSITQATELGAVYTLAEIEELCAIARAYDMPVHMDGTRLANALARSNHSAAEMTWRAGVDILCLGATKNGALAAEAVVIFDPARAWEFELRRKRGGHLFSKMRFVSAQIEAFLTDGLWLGLAGHANAMADRLAAGMAGIKGAEVTNSVEANMLFATITCGQHRRLQEAGARYYPMNPTQDEAGAEDAPLDIRLVTSFRTEPGDVDRFLEVLAG